MKTEGLVEVVTAPRGPRGAGDAWSYPDFGPARRRDRDRSHRLDRRTQQNRDSDALGIYGVVGLMVATRTREIAVRVALGASRRRVLAMILFDVVKLAVPGVAVGLVITIAFVRLNGENLGIPLSNMEPLAYVAGAAVAILVAVLASLAPARRAASVQPMVAMRSV